MGGAIQTSILYRRIATEDQKARTTVELGLIEEAGDLGQNSVYQNATLRNGLYHTSEYDFRKHLDYAFASGISNGMASHAHEAHLITSLDPARLLELAKAQHGGIATAGARWQSDPRFSYIVGAMEKLDASDEETTPITSSNSQRATLSEIDALLASSDSRSVALFMVTKSIVERMADMLFMSADGIDPCKGVAAYGMDSLIAAELRNWFLGTYKCTISFLKLLERSTSIKELADIVVESRVAELGGHGAVEDAEKLQNGDSRNGVHYG